MELKLDENGNVCLDDKGLPIFIFKEEGAEPTENGVDVPSLFIKIKNLNKESMDHRLAGKASAEKLKPVIDAGIEDLEAFIAEAASNKEAVGNFNEKDLKSVEEVNQIKQGVSDSYEQKIKDLNTVIGDMNITSTTKLAQKDQNIRDLVIKGAFDRSDFIKDRTVLTPEIAFHTFGRSFKIEETDDGGLETFALKSDGEKVYSMANPGQLANPEEAIELLIKGHSDSASILRTSSGGDDQDLNPGKKTGGMTPADFAKLTPTEKLKHVHKLKK